MPVNLTFSLLLISEWKLSSRPQPVVLNGTFKELKGIFHYFISYRFTLSNPIDSFRPPNHVGQFIFRTKNRGLCGGNLKGVSWNGLIDCFLVGVG